MDLSEMSCVQWFEGIEKHRCGYCKTEDSSISNGMWAETLTVQDYQDLIDRGWRRSGKYCYKPIMDKTCCPQYTIKCDISKFSLSKSQKKVVKKFNKFINEDKVNKNDTTTEEQFADGYESSNIFMEDGPDIKLANIHSVISESMKQPESSNAKGNDNYDGMKRKEEICDKSKITSSLPVKSVKSKTSFCGGKGADLNKPPLKKAKLLRIERKKEKLLKRGLIMEKNESEVKKTLEQFLEDISSNSKNKLQIHLISTSRPSFDWESIEEEEYQLYKQYQMIVHNDPPSKLSKAGFCRFLVKTPLQMTLQRMSKNNGHFAVSAELYKKYQMSIHNEPLDECDVEQFYRFLVQSPLEPEDFPDGIEGPGYGSFHQQYWINKKLVAVGVIDILPKCVSSVYFFYDPEYRYLTLGTYGSLREVQFTRSLHHKLTDICSYYMGFYIHSCPKMRYKGKLTPSFLLCPETYYWVPIEKCIELLDSQKYSRLNEDIDALDENVPIEEDILKIKSIYAREEKRVNRENYDQLSKIKWGTGLSSGNRPVKFQSNPRSIIHIFSSLPCLLRYQLL